MRSHWIPSHNRIRWYIASNSCFTCKLYIISNCNMTSTACLSCKDYMVTTFCTTCNPNLCNQETIFSNLNIVAKVNKIVNFCTATYQGRSHCSIINSSARANFYIIFITDNSIIINNTIGTNSYIFTKCNILANNSCTMHFTGNYNRWMEYF